MSEEKTILPLERFGIEVEISGIEEEDVDSRISFEVGIKEEDVERFGESAIMDEAQKVMTEILSSEGWLEDKEQNNALVSSL
jgi:hypothetical protein